MKQISGIIIIIALIGLLFGAAFVCGCTGTTETKSAEPAPAQTEAPVQATVEETPAPVAEVTQEATPEVTAEAANETNATEQVVPQAAEPVVNATVNATNETPVLEQNASAEMPLPVENKTVTEPVNNTSAPSTV